MGKQNKIFVGIDPSYNSTGIIVLDHDAKIIEQKNFGTSKDKEVEERIIEFEKEIKFIPNIVGLQSVYIEGPSYSSNGQFVLQMGALHFFLRIFLFKKGVNYKVVAPGTLKKFIFKGNAKKDLILLKVYKRWGEEFEVNDLADAYGLARMALEGFKE
jgi:crossover junction endodeoxyribonuclease RuvC